MSRWTNQTGKLPYIYGWFQTLFLWILKSLDFEISILSSDSQNYVILRNCGTIKLQSTEISSMLNLMSQSNCVYHLMYLRYYALKFQFHKIFTKRRWSRDLNCLVSDSFFIANLTIESKSRNPNFLESIGIKFETNLWVSKIGFQNSEISGNDFLKPQTENSLSLSMINFNRSRQIL